VAQFSPFSPAWLPPRRTRQASSGLSAAPDRACVLRPDHRAPRYTPCRLTKMQGCLCSAPRLALASGRERRLSGQPSRLIAPQLPLPLRQQRRQTVRQPTLGAVSCSQAAARCLAQMGSCLPLHPARAKVPRGLQAPSGWRARPATVPCPPVRPPLLPRLPVQALQPPRSSQQQYGGGSGQGMYPPIYQSECAWAHNLQLPGSGPTGWVPAITSLPPVQCSVLHPFAASPCCVQAYPTPRALLRSLQAPRRAAASWMRCRRTC